MSLKDSWKKTGQELGLAFGGLGKTILKSADQIVDDVDSATFSSEKAPKESTVFNDGSWRGVGKDLGSAFSSLGKSTLESVKVGVDTALDEIDAAESQKSQEKK